MERQRRMAARARNCSNFAHCMISLQPLGYEVPSKTLLSYSELWKSGLRAGGGGGEGGGGGGRGGVGPSVRRQRLVQNQLWRVLPAGRVIKPQVINQAMGLLASGSLYYFNYLDSTAYPLSELLSSDLFLSGLLNVQAPPPWLLTPSSFCWKTPSWPAWLQTSSPIWLPTPIRSACRRRWSRY
uniref:fez family zinc finger protein 2-like n=1 Tax=Callithrix jacchus TaxID=9483 RepID=UPI0023DCFA2B|nr:fez family zinc finger protein 2-like [Callithrix jacchus]